MSWRQLNGNWLFTAFSVALAVLTNAVLIKMIAKVLERDNDAWTWSNKQTQAVRQIYRSWASRRFSQIGYELEWAGTRQSWSRNSASKLWQTINILATKPCFYLSSKQICLNRWLVYTLFDPLNACVPQWNLFLAILLRSKIQQWLRWIQLAIRAMAGASWSFP